MSREDYRVTNIVPLGKMAENRYVSIYLNLDRWRYTGEVTITKHYIHETLNYNTEVNDLRIMICLN